MARTVLTTGANSGIGLATAVELARRGHRSIGTVRSEEKGEVLQRAARNARVHVETALLDVTNAERAVAVIDEFRPDALVNNAGYGLSAPVEQVSDDDAGRIIETMLMAPVRLARAALPHMREVGWGRIVNISSILGRVTMPLSGWYQAAKHGLEAVSDALRVEVARDGVAVVLVEPGFFRTAIFDELDADEQRYSNERYAAAYRRTREAFNRSSFVMGDPARVARTVARVVESRQPRARYLVGVDARWLDATRSVTPTELSDRLRRLATGL